MCQVARSIHSFENKKSERQRMNLELTEGMTSLYLKLAFNRNPSW